MALHCARATFLWTRRTAPLLYTWMMTAGTVGLHEQQRKRQRCAGKPPWALCCRDEEPDAGMADDVFKINDEALGGCCICCSPTCTGLLPDPAVLSPQRSRGVTVLMRTLMSQTARKSAASGSTRSSH
jgi:predicted RNA polymerase sigma factor